MNITLFPRSIAENIVARLSEKPKVLEAMEISMCQSFFMALLPYKT
jgi:hypothetical protein